MRRTDLRYHHAFQAGIARPADQQEKTQWAYAS